MSTELAAMPDKAPEYAVALLQQYGLKPLNDIATAGIGAGMPPSIGCKGTRFVTKENGEEKILQRLEIGVVVLAAKDALIKRFYAGAYNPDAQAEAPDCYSLNGKTPEADCKNKQCETCAVCPMNQFGSGTDAQGNPAKGKACGDRKVLAIFAAGKVWQFEITPAALKNFGEYVRQSLNPRGLDIRTVITTVGFDEKASFPQYTFKFGGVLPNEQLVEVLKKVNTPEVDNIINWGGAPAAPQIAEKPESQDDGAAQAAAEAAAKAEADAKKAAADEKKRKTAEAAAKKKADEEAAKAAAAAQDDGFGGLGGATTETVATQTVATQATTAAAPTDDALAAALGLDL